MGYVLKLRQLIGQQPLVVVGAAAVVRRHQQLLLVKRLDNGLWGLPAGSKELNESLETTAIRELREETGLLATQAILLGNVSGAGMQYTYPNGDRIDSVTAVYRLEATGTPTGSNETRESRFWDSTALPADLTPITRQILATVPLNQD